jgi:glucose-6-phosphate 1-dehydrogenase
MEAPTGLHCDAIRDEQVKVFRAIPPLDPKNLVRGQFKGYKAEKGVPSDSKVETFAALRLEIQSWRWSGVPFLIRAGKCLPVTTTEVLVKLRKPPLDNLAGESTNHFRFRLGPGEISISLSARVKRSGEELASKPAQRAIVDPILGNATTLEEYEPGSWGPHAAVRLADDVGGWHDPEGRNEDTVTAPRAA